MSNSNSLKVAVAMILASIGAAQAASSGYTLLVAPARYSVMQVAFDVVARNPAVLVSYQGEGDTAEPLLHAWNGREWINISMQDFREVSFVDQMPARTILLGDDSTLPAVLGEAASWSPEIQRVTTLTTSALVNEFGRIFDWSGPEWRWFAKRYNLEMHDESESQRTSSWYDQPGPLYRPPLRDVIKLEKRPASEPTPAPFYEGSRAAPVQYEMPPASEPEAPVESESSASWATPAPITTDDALAN